MAVTGMITSHAIKAFSYWLLHSAARQVAPLQRRVAKILNGIEADRKQAKSETSTDWFKRQREVSGKDVNFRDIETRLPRCEGQKLPVP